MLAKSLSTQFTQRTVITRSRPSGAWVCNSSAGDRLGTHTPAQLEKCQHLIGKTEAKVSYFGSSQRQHNPFIDAFYFRVAGVRVSDTVSHSTWWNTSSNDENESLHNTFYETAKLQQQQTRAKWKKKKKENTRARDLSGGRRQEAESLLSMPGMVYDTRAVEVLATYSQTCTTIY